MKKAFVKLMGAVLAVSMLAACGGGASSSGSVASGSGGTSSSGGGSVGTPSVYRQLYGQEFTTLNYYATGNTNETKVIANMVDALVEYDKYGIVQPGLAESWAPNDDNTVWTFQIRQGVKWVDADGNEVGEVTAQDFVDAAEYVNNGYNASAVQSAYNGIVLNAQEYMDSTTYQLEAENAVADGTAESVEAYYEANEINPDDFVTFDEVGVKATDTYTLEYTCDGPCPFFESMLTFASFLPVYGPFLEEQGENFGVDNYAILYNGPYILSEYEPQNRRVLTVNPTYWDPDNITIERLEYIFNQDPNTIAPTMFQSGDVDYAEIGADILDEWYNNDATKDLVHPMPPELTYSYFYGFNFEPRFDNAYEPENWVLAVNNENFRKSIQAGLDRLKALAVQDPYNPETLLNNSVTPAAFAAQGGMDYTQYAPLKAITDGDSFDEAAAKEYRDAAMEELTAAGATFPVKILMPFNPNTTNWDKECQIVEQQLEQLLGTDYIDIIVEAGPSTGFLGEVRRSGKYALMKLNWGADYADPQTYSDPFGRNNTYNFMNQDADRMIGDLPANRKTAETQAIVEEYYTLIDAAKAESVDMAARYEAFAEAEAYLIEHAIIVPFSVDTTGYVADLRDPFTRPYAPFGLPQFRYKGVTLLEKSMTTDEYNAAHAQWVTEFEAAQAAAAK